jgi:hypothetical protein
MTTPLRKTHPPFVSFEFRVSGFEFEKGSKINPPGPGGDVLARAMFVRLASGNFVSGLHRKRINTP